MYKLSEYNPYQGCGYPKQVLNYIKLICHNSTIYIPKIFWRRVLYWYYLYLHHPGGSRLSKNIWKLRYWKSIVNQAEIYDKPCKIYQQFKKINPIYGNLTPNNIAEKKTSGTVHAEMIDTYSKSIRQYHRGGATINSDVSITYMAKVYPCMDWFEIFEVPAFNIDEVTVGNDEYINESYSRVSRLCNNTWLCKYPHPQKVMFDNRYKFKRELNPFLNYFDIKTVLTTINTHKIMIWCIGCTN